jgi:hypothetical protein
MQCYSCGGNNGLIIHEVSGNILTLPEHKYKEHCVQKLKSDIDKIKEFLNEKIGYDELADPQDNYYERL